MDALASISAARPLGSPCYFAFLAFFMKAGIATGAALFLVEDFSATPGRFSAERLGDEGTRTASARTAAPNEVMRIIACSFADG